MRTRTQLLATERARQRHWPVARLCSETITDAPSRSREECCWLCEEKPERFLMGRERLSQSAAAYTLSSRSSTSNVMGLNRRFSPPLSSSSSSPSLSSPRARQQHLVQSYILAQHAESPWRRAQRRNASSAQHGRPQHNAGKRKTKMIQTVMPIPKKRAV
jgi:hypothetical protein